MDIETLKGLVAMLIIVAFMLSALVLYLIVNILKIKKALNRHELLINKKKRCCNCM